MNLKDISLKKIGVGIIIVSTISALIIFYSLWELNQEHHDWAYSIEVLPFALGQTWEGTLFWLLFWTGKMNEIDQLGFTLSRILIIIPFIIVFGILIIIMGVMMKDKKLIKET